MAQGMTGEGAVIARLLHTVPSLAATFDGLVRATPHRVHQKVRPVHVVDGWLLETVRRDGVTAAVRDAVVMHARQLASIGARAVLVTCSSIGEVAEAAAGHVSVPVIRVDAAMADEAVEIASTAPAGGRIAVLATLTSTLGPTGRLVRRAANSAARSIEVTAELVEGAAEAHDRGDRERVEELVAAAVVRAGVRADVIVLAQASMAGAADRTDVAVPVLRSPASGVRSLLDVLSSNTLEQA
jgi:Asp/Glu/Hydantoin racemase